MPKLLKKENNEPAQVSLTETGILIKLLEETLEEQIVGDVVEFGCYLGDTSLILKRTIDHFFKTQNQLAPFEKLPSRASSQNLKTLYLYDSFEGLPQKTKEDHSVAGDQFQAGKLPATKREVIEKFKRQNLTLPKIKKAFFEDLDSNIDLPEKISFAFLDGDFYSSIKTSFGLISQKLQKGSIIAVHDYNNPELPGSACAVDEWLKKHSGQYSSFAIRETLAIIKI